jgi:hypothetical protein
LTGFDLEMLIVLSEYAKDIPELMSGPLKFGPIMRSLDVKSEAFLSQILAKSTNLPRR